MKNLFVINKGFQCLLLIAVLINTAWAQGDGNYGFDDEIAQGINKYENQINDEELYNGGYLNYKSYAYNGASSFGKVSNFGMEKNHDDRESIGEDGKGGFYISQENEDRITEGAPPPPFTPDVPIKSVWGKTLIIGAIVLYILNKRKL